MGAALVAATALAATPASAQNADKIFNYKGADRQKMLEKGAKKEGKVTFYSALIVNQALRPLAESFEKKYPYIDVEYWRGNSSKIIKKVLAEKRAKKWSATLPRARGSPPA
jgi:ABC-type glycerol-3-phosphate transport system substrate-binding protein